MSLVHSTYSEAPQNARHPSMQFDMKMAPSSHGPTKRKPSGGSGFMEQEDEVHPSPTKRACTSPSVHQGRHVPAPSDTPESEAALTFVNFLDQKIVSKPARMHPRLHIGNIPQAHVSSAWSSSSIPGALPDEPTDTQLTVGGRDSDQTQPSSLEKARMAKGKRPDRGRRPKHEAGRVAMAQEFLSFLARNVQMAEPNREASSTCLFAHQQHLT
ncbi:hypothetical protein LXA43DRAFT_288864 [Ganoderma leucocontextum]|nr:hypothetical protein LXA43DRAFT_288864 [Ganoderma leucocontextum]